MVDGQAESAGVAADNPAPAGQVAPTNYFAPDGKLLEGWTNSLPEDIRGEKCLQTYKNVPDIVRSTVLAQRMIGKDKVAVPNEKSTQVEWDEFWKAGGRPETAEDYNFVKPQDIPEEHWSKERADNYQKLAHKIGLSKKQADELFSWNNADVMQGIKANQQAQELALEQAEEQLQKDWGNAFEQKKHLGNIAIDQACGGNEEFRLAITQKYGNDPDFIRFASNLGAKFAEHGTVSVGRMMPTPSDMKSQITELMATDAYKNGQNPDHKNMVAKVQRLFEEKAKAEGRDKGQAL